MLNNFSRFKQWFVKLGFWKKLILIFTINTVIILIVMNVLMQILFAQVNNNISAISTSETNQYISISNSLVGVSIANSLLSGLEIFADLIVQVDGSMHFFRNRTNIYVSLLSGTAPYNPPLTSNFSSTPDFKKPAMFFYNNNSTFHNEPYLDLLLSSMLGQIEQQKIKRMNIIYQSLTNPSDIFAVTIPGTNDFTIPSVQNVNDRFFELTKDFVTITGLYNDTFSISQSNQQLISLRTVQFQGNFRILMQTEIYQNTLSSFFGKVFYYPSTQIILFQVTQQNPPMYQLINVDSFEINLTDCVNHGVHEFNLPNGTVLNGYSIAVNQSFAIGQSPNIISNELLAQMSNMTGSFRVVLLVNKDELSTSNGIMLNFLDKQKSTLSIVIYGWSFVILLATIGLSIVTGNYIFYNLKTLSQKLQQYTKAPSKMHKIIFELKELESSGIIKKLIDNVVTVMEKIQERKKNRNQSISPMIYPLNLAEKQFSAKHNLGDEEKWEEWKQLLIQAKEKMKKDKIRSTQRNTSLETKGFTAQKFGSKIWK